jgi:hypothetical protein
MKLYTPPPSTFYIPNIYSSVSWQTKGDNLISEPLCATFVFFGVPRQVLLWVPWQTKGDNLISEPLCATFVFFGLPRRDLFSVALHLRGKRDVLELAGEMSTEHSGTLLGSCKVGIASSFSRGARVGLENTGVEHATL